MAFFEEFMVSESGNLEFIHEIESGFAAPFRRTRGGERSGIQQEVRRRRAKRDQKRTATPVTTRRWIASESTSEWKNEAPRASPIPTWTAQSWERSQMAERF